MSFLKKIGGWWILAWLYPLAWYFIMNLRDFCDYNVCFSNTTVSVSFSILIFFIVLLFLPLEFISVVISFILEIFLKIRLLDKGGMFSSGLLKSNSRLWFAISYFLLIFLLVIFFRKEKKDEI